MMEALLAKLSFVVSIGLQAVILAILISRHLRKRFFWFFVYILYEVLESIIRLSVSADQSWYLRVYWLTEVADAILSLVAFGESFLNVFRPYTRLRWFMRIVWSGIGLALLYAIFKAWIFPPIESNRAIQVIIGLDVALSYSLSVVGILYLALIWLLQIRKYQWESAVILGFTVNFTVASFGFLTRSVFGTRLSMLSEWLPAVAYIMGAIIWALGLWRREPQVSEPMRELQKEDLETLDRHITIMDRILKRDR
jgi:hypothetical protein